MFYEGKTHPGHISDHKKGNEHDDDEWDAGPVESHNGFIEPEAGDEEIKAHRGGGISDLKISEKMIPVDRINSVV